jgi:transposase-like protein
MWTFPISVDTKLSLPQNRRGGEYGRSMKVISSRAEAQRARDGQDFRESAAAVARDLGIESGLSNRWRREQGQEAEGKKAFTGQGVPRDEEHVQLRREAADLRETNEILKKAVGCREDG